MLKIYPLERFLDNGKVVKNKKGHDLSLRQFQSYLGLSYHYSRSGDSSHAQNKVTKDWQGSSLTRSDLFAWLLSNPCKINKFKPKTATQCKLKQLWTEERNKTVFENGKEKTITLPSFENLGKDGICRMLFPLSRWLWYDLLDKIESLTF